MTMKIGNEAASDLVHLPVSIKATHPPGGTIVNSFGVTILTCHNGQDAEIIVKALNEWGKLRELAKGWTPPPDVDGFLRRAAERNRVAHEAKGR